MPNIFTHYDLNLGSFHIEGYLIEVTTASPYDRLTMQAIATPSLSMIGSSNHVTLLAFGKRGEEWKRDDRRCDRQGMRVRRERGGLSYAALGRMFATGKRDHSVIVRTQISTSCNG